MQQFFEGANYFWCIGSAEYVVPLRWLKTHRSAGRLNIKSQLFCCRQVSTIVWDCCNKKSVISTRTLAQSEGYTHDRNKPHHLADRGIAVIHSTNWKNWVMLWSTGCGNIHWHRWKMRCSWWQSNGMGQWLKQSLAQNSALGIAAAIKVQLPSVVYLECY